jgi:hypothetical protein
MACSECLPTLLNALAEKCLLFAGIDANSVGTISYQQLLSWLKAAASDSGGKPTDAMLRCSQVLLDRASAGPQLPRNGHSNGTQRAWKASF